MRIEDIDPPREMPGASERILAALDAHGFEYPVPLYQSSRLDAYDAAISRLLDDGHAYRCSCSRRMLKATAPTGRAGLIYPGTCRDGADERERPATAVRLLTTGATVCFSDALQGEQMCDVASEIGDFLLRRGDGLVAYQLAVALDDAEQQISQVVRGTDLHDSTFMQRLILEKLGLTAPEYAHVPVVTGPDGSKLSKQTGAIEVDNNYNSINLLRAFSFLLQEPPGSLKAAPPAAIWDWAREHWDPTRLEGVQSRPERSIMVQ